MNFLKDYIDWVEQKINGFIESIEPNVEDDIVDDEYFDDDILDVIDED